MKTKRQPTTRRQPKLPAVKCLYYRKDKEKGGVVICEPHHCAKFENGDFNGKDIVLVSSRQKSYYDEPEVVLLQNVRYVNRMGVLYCLTCDSIKAHDLESVAAAT